MIVVVNNFKGLIFNNEKCRRVWEVQTLASEVAVVSILKMDTKHVCEAKKLLLICHTQEYQHRKIFVG